MPRGGVQRIPRIMSILGILFAVLSGSVARASDMDVSMGLQDFGKGTYHLVGHVTVDACAETAWSVLTAYSDISSFISSMRKSNVKEYNGDRIVLEQEAAGKVLFFSRRVHVTLMVTEKPMTEIRFEDVEHRDFRYYYGSWEIAQAEKGLEIVYRLECQRNFAAPNFLAKGALKKSAEGLLAEVRAEILRRQGESHEDHCHPS